MSKLTPAHAQERAARGAARLDRLVPGWEQAIDVGTLNLADIDHCICGQLGWFTKAGALTIRQAVSYGVLVNAWEDDAVAEYRLLQDAWLNEIARRLYPDRVLADPPVAASVWE